MRILLSILILLISFLNRGTVTNDLPHVLPESHSDLVSLRLKTEAAMKFEVKKLPDNLKEWELYRSKLKDRIIKTAGVFTGHELPLNMKETGRIELKGYSIRNISFQTRPGTYATANLYVPYGKGPFPGVINMCGHWNKAKIDTAGPQAVGHSLALNGYVCLTIDPWGSGERTTVHGIFEDHGDDNNLGSALLDIGQPLIGLEISDNIRGIDLLCSLPYVDSKKIGATGASGGGTQTLWLSALDERIRAVIMVVSAGTFESHVLGSPCICEVMNGALNFSEESGVLALIAPRALKMCNHTKDDIPAFNPTVMLRSYTNAKPVFRLYGDDKNIDYQLFDLRHGYWREDREALLGWFDLYLKNKGNGSARKEIPFRQISDERLMVFAKGERDQEVTGTMEFCKKQGESLRAGLMSSTIDTAAKKGELLEILGLNEKPELKKVHEFGKTDIWNRIALETSDNKLIPLLVHQSSSGSAEFVIISDPEGKDKIPPGLITEYLNAGAGIAVIDLTGTGEASARGFNLGYSNGGLRVLSRSELWFGRTMIGEWVEELNTTIQFLKSTYKATRITIDGDKETGLAGLFLFATISAKGKVIMREAPVSYLFDTREGLEFFSTGVHLPGILKWGDISLAAALTNADVHFIEPVTMSGTPVKGEQLKAVQTEFEKITLLCKSSGRVGFE